jgi:hypothetical protein
MKLPTLCANLQSSRVSRITIGSSSLEAVSQLTRTFGGYSPLEDCVCTERMYTSVRIHLQSPFTESRPMKLVHLARMGTILHFIHSDLNHCSCPSRRLIKTPLVLNTNFARWAIRSKLISEPVFQILNLREIMTVSAVS